MGRMKQKKKQYQRNVKIDNDDCSFVRNKTKQNIINNLEMDYIVKELGISYKNIFPTASPGLYTVVVHTTWLKKWIKNLEVDTSVNNVDFTLQPGESVPYPWRKIFMRVSIYL